MSTHTPGPWDRTNLTIHTQSTEHRGALGLAHIFDWIETDGVTNANEATANARLIAAAPALLEALEGVLRTHFPVVNIGELPSIQNARAAIHAAKGSA